MMETYVASSSNIDQATYDSDLQDLTVTFRDGNEYVYHGVPYTVFLGLQNARSAGEYFYRQIRSVYAYEQT